MVKIISDSTCDLSQELLRKYEIDILPLHILLGEKNMGMEKTLPRIRFIPGLTQIRQRLKLLLLPWQMPWNFSAHMQRLEEKLSAFLFQQVCPPLEM